MRVQNQAIIDLFRNRRFRKKRSYENLKIEDFGRVLSDPFMGIERTLFYPKQEIFQCLLAFSILLSFFSIQSIESESIKKTFQHKQSLALKGSTLTKTEKRLLSERRYYDQRPQRARDGYSSIAMLRITNSDTN